jgi:hypothetical protein
VTQATVFGYVVLSALRNGDQFSQFFQVQDYLQNYRVIEGDCHTSTLYDATCELNSSRYQRGYFYLCTDATDQPKTLHLPNRNASIVSVMTGNVTNADYLRRVRSDLWEVEDDQLAAVLLAKLNRNVVGKQSYATQIDNSLLTYLQGDWCSILLSLASPMTFVLASGLPDALVVHCVYLDGVYAVVFSNDVGWLPVVQERIQTAGKSGKLFVVTCNMVDVRLVTLNWTFLISKFHRWCNSLLPEERLLVLHRLAQNLANKAK